MATHYATVHLGSTPSTQDEARSRFDGTPVLVVADQQTAGRGRKGRSWLSAPRGLAASLAVAPSWPRAEWPRLTLVAGLAAQQALGPTVALDWPNDLVIEAASPLRADAKVGGLLAEAADGVVVFGLGANLWWPLAPEGVAALFAQDPGPTAAAGLAAAFASELLRRLGGDSADWGRQQYLALCVTVGSSVTWEAGQGVAIDVAADGALMVQTDSGVVELHSSQVERIGRSTVPPMRPTS